jgi:hypothetical protein
MKKKDMIKDYVKYLLPALIVLVFGLMALSCGTIKEVPVQYIEKIEYRDSLIYIHDSIKIPVPVEKTHAIIPVLDTSYLSTSVAESVAYLDTAKRKIHHTLEQKGAIKTVYDTIIKVQYVDRIIKKEVPVQVDVIKYKRDSLFWVLLIWAILCVIIAGLRIYFRR